MKKTNPKKTWLDGLEEGRDRDLRAHSLDRALLFMQNGGKPINENETIFATADRMYKFVKTGKFIGVVKKPKVKK